MININFNASIYIKYYDTFCQKIYDTFCLLKGYIIYLPLAVIYTIGSKKNRHILERMFLDNDKVYPNDSFR